MSASSSTTLGHLQTIVLSSFFPSILAYGRPRAHHKFVFHDKNLCIHTPAMRLLSSFAHNRFRLLGLFFTFPAFFPASGCALSGHTRTTCPRRGGVWRGIVTGGHPSIHPVVPFLVGDAGCGAGSPRWRTGRTGLGLRTRPGLLEGGRLSTHARTQ